MIDWRVAAELLADLMGRRVDVAERSERALSDAPRFRNVEYPVSPLPLALSAAALGAHRRDVEGYLRLLERVLELYRSRADVRAYFRLRPVEEALAGAKPRLRPEIRICRLDGFPAAEDGALRIIENNSDCPAGILFTERLDTLVDGIVADAARRAGVAPVLLPLDRGGAVRDEILAAYRESGGAEPAPRVAILQLEGRASAESQELARELSAQGSPAFVADPRELAPGGTRARLAGRAVDVVWNKINTVDWRRLAASSPEVERRWAEAVAAGRVCHLNPFGPRCVTENKLCSAFLQEPRFAALLRPAERALASRLLPWARKLEPGRRFDYAGREWDPAELARARQVELVLKEPYDIRGAGVTVGRSTPRDEWDERVARGLREGHLLQRFVAGSAYPVLCSAADAPVVSMTVSLDAFAFGGRLVGLGAKASLGDKVNVFAGGRKLAARPYAPEAGRPA